MRYFAFPLGLVALALAGLALVVEVSAAYVADALLHTSEWVMRLGLKVAKVGLPRA